MRREAAGPGASKWDPHSLETTAKQHKQQHHLHHRQPLDYSSSDGEDIEDERARLRNPRSKHQAMAAQSTQQYSSGGSDNTYAEANLLTGSNAVAGRYDGKS